MENKSNDLTPEFLAKQKASLVEFQEQIIVQYAEQQKINKAWAVGNPSPDFKDYTVYEGGTSSLSDYRGSYVYIDVWATWCAPCKYEIPFLEKVEEEYAGKNIKFISMSIDRKADEPKWREMIKNKNMKGIQILADKEFESDFIQQYFIQGIPRFILLDKEGNILSPDAPRPSEDSLKTMLNALDI